MYIDSFMLRGSVQPNGHAIIFTNYYNLVYLIWREKARFFEHKIGSFGSFVGGISESQHIPVGASCARDLSNKMAKNPKTKFGAKKQGFLNIK